MVGNVKIDSRANAPKIAPKFVIQDLIGALEDRIQKKDMIQSYRGDSRLMWCTKVAEDDSYYQLILESGDKNVSDFAYVNFETLQSRDSKKNENEGGHYASHVLIKKALEEYNRHLILIEKVPGISLSSVKAYLSWACTEGYCDKQAHDDKRKLRTFSPHIKIDGHQSRTIREALRVGTLQDIKFVGYKKEYDDELDEDPNIREVIQQTTWEVKKRINDGQALLLFERLAKAMERFLPEAEDPQVFLRIKAENGQLKQTEISQNRAEILEQAFVQNEIVKDFDEPLPQRYPEFRQDVIEKMQSLEKKLGE